MLDELTPVKGFLNELVLREKNRRKIEYKAFEKREETKQKGKKNQNRKIKEIRKCKNSQKRKKRFLKVV